MSLERIEVLKTSAQTELSDQFQKQTRYCATASNTTKTVGEKWNLAALFVPLANPFRRSGIS